MIDSISLSIPELILVAIAAAGFGGLGVWFAPADRPPAQPSVRMPIMVNAYIFAALAIGLIVAIVLIHGRVVELNDMAWGAVGSILTMLTIGFGKVVETNIFLIRRMAGGGDEEGGGAS
ncbi:MAG: hypothetical protein F4Y34_08275 [Gammaproteobacteria bacterium]|nr:hypothetical protein [Gammaproteobacteria bacterium]